jgi:outer membrane lipoprotein-sorting protein
MKTIITWTAVFVTLTALAFAAPPRTINYQGYLKNGTAPAGPTSMTFSLYSTTSGAGAVWNSNQGGIPGGTKVSVTPVNGVYSVELGASPQPALPEFDRQFWLGVKAADDAEMRPLQALSSVPYALNATSVNGQTLTSLDSRYIDPVQPIRPTPLQIATLRWDQVGHSGVFPVGPLPSAIAFDGANIWVTNLGNATVTKMRVSDGTILGSYPSGASPYGIAFDGANIWITHNIDSTVTKLRASDGVTIGTYNVTNPWGIAFDGANMWVTSTSNNTVTKLRASDGLLQGVYATGLTPLHITFDGSSIWVVNSDSKNITKRRASDGTLLGTFDVQTTPRMSAFDGTNIWVANSGSNTISQLVASDGGLYDHFPVGIYPGTIIFDGVNLWVAYNFEQSIYKMRTDGTILNVYPMSEPVFNLAFDGSNIWAVLNASGQVAKIPITTESTSAYIPDASVTNTKLAFEAVATNNIANGSVSSGKLAVGAVTTTSIADSAVTTTKIGAGAVKTASIADSSVTTAKIVAGAVTTSSIANGAVTTANIADGAVTTAKIASSGVTTANIADNAITVNKIGNGAISTAKIADGAVTDAKISGPIDYSKINIPIYPFRGSAFLSIPTGGWRFIGTTATVTTLAGQRISGTAQAGLGRTGSKTTPNDEFYYHLCFRSNGTSNIPTSFDSNWFLGNIATSNIVQYFIATGSVIPGAGTWDVGFCLSVLADVLDHNGAFNGWVMLTN